VDETRDVRTRPVSGAGVPGMEAPSIGGRSQAVPQDRAAKERRILSITTLRDSFKLSCGGEVLTCIRICLVNELQQAVRMVYALSGVPPKG